MASYYGFEKPIEFFRNQFKVGRDGLSVKAMCTILDKIYLAPTLYTIKHLNNLEKKYLPCIMCLENHYVVLERIHKGYCFMMDPAVGRCKKSIEEIENIFVGHIVCVAPNNGFRKNVERNSEYRYIKKYLYKARGLLSCSVLVCILGTLVTILIPDEMQRLVDEVLYQKINIWNNTTILSIFCLIVSFYLTNILKNMSLVKLQSKLIKQCSYDATIHLLKVKYEFYDNKPPGDMIFRMNLLRNTEQIISTTVISFITSSVMIVFVLIYFLLNFRLFGCYTLGISIGVFLLVLYKNYKLSIINEKYLRESKKFENFQTEQIINMYSIKAMGLEKYFGKKCDHIFNYYKTAYKVNQNEILKFNTNISSLEVFLPLFLIVSGMVFGVINNLTVGNTMLLYVLTGYLLRYETLLMNSIFQFTRIKTSLFFINDILDEPEETNVSDIMVEQFDFLKIENMSFKYNDTQNWILDDINISLKKGECIAIVGASGHGKSTLLKLLYRLYKPVKGTILINGYRLDEVNINSYHALLGIVTQQFSMFNGSIRENIVLGNDNISDEEIYSVLEIVNLSGEIQNMPMGLNTMISAHSNNLSGGQMQRIAIARALIKRPQILLLDEATSALDINNESSILNSIKRLGISLIIVSHRHSTVHEADTIYYMDNGKIVEKCTNDKLMMHNVEY